MHRMYGELGGRFRDMEDEHEPPRGGLWGDIFGGRERERAG